VRSEFGIGREECVLLAVGTLERHKGHDVLIRALAGLTRDGLGVPWRLIIAGGRGGDQHESLKQLVGIEGLEGRVHIVTNRNDIPDLLALSDVFVMPSLWEGLPMALLEAMLAGKAVVASATAGIPEAVVNERDGILTAPGNVTHLGAALRDLLENPAKRLALGTAAAVRARKEFTVGVMADRYEALYRQPAAATRRIAGDRMFDPLLSLVVGDATRAPAYSPMPLSKQNF
jgi:glycosyltransferase involved in cell wall biosynthesis